MGRMAVLLCGTTLLASMPAYAGGGRRVTMSTAEDARLAERESAAPAAIESFEAGFAWVAVAIGVALYIAGTALVIWAILQIRGC